MFVCIRPQTWVLYKLHSTYIQALVSRWIVRTVFVAFVLFIIIIIFKYRNMYYFLEFRVVLAIISWPQCPRRLQRTGNKITYNEQQFLGEQQCVFFLEVVNSYLVFVIVVVAVAIVVVSVRLYGRPYGPLKHL